MRSFVLILFAGLMFLPGAAPLLAAGFDHAMQQAAPAQQSEAKSSERKKYYINKGVKYHIGDNRFGRSADSFFMKTHPVVGQEWVVNFTVDQADDVEVQIDKIWGVDDCPYCKVIITIDDFDMGRLFQENNRRAFTTPKPLWFKAVAGVTHTLKIASYGKTRVDDFVVQDVAVISAARLKYSAPTYIEPIRPQAPPPPKKVIGNCSGSVAAAAWLPSDDVSRGSLKLASVLDFSQKKLQLSLKPNDYMEGVLRVNKVETGDTVGQAIEVMLGQGEQAQGWVMQFAPGQDKLVHTNHKRFGVYRSERFRGSAYKPQQWNRLRVSRCPDGSAQLFINGRRVGKGIPLKTASESVYFRVRGMTAELAPRAY